jgi:hypothetical protein
MMPGWLVLNKHLKIVILSKLKKICIPFLYFRLRMELINRWSSCQADYCSYSESSGDNFEDEHEDIEPMPHSIFIKRRRKQSLTVLHDGSVVFRSVCRAVPGFAKVC